MGMQVVDKKNLKIKHCISCPYQFASNTPMLTIFACFTCVVVQPLFCLPCVVDQPYVVVIEQLFLFGSDSQLVPYGAYQLVQELFAFSLLFNQKYIGGFPLSVGLGVQSLLGFSAPQSLIYVLSFEMYLEGFYMLLSPYNHPRGPNHVVRGDTRPLVFWPKSRQ